MPHVSTAQECRLVTVRGPEIIKRLLSFLKSLAFFLFRHSQATLAKHAHRYCSALTVRTTDLSTALTRDPVFIVLRLEWPFSSREDI